MSSSINTTITSLQSLGNSEAAEITNKRIKRMSHSRFSNVALAAMALAICGGSLQAAIVANSSTLTLYCDTVLGPTPATVGIKLSAAGSAVNVTVTAPTLPVMISARIPSPLVRPPSTQTSPSYWRPAAKAQSTPQPKSSRSLPQAERRSP